MKRLTTFAVLGLLVTGVTSQALAVGQLEPADSETGTGAPAALVARSHHISVLINNGFCRTETVQVFANVGDRGMEARYSLPLPESASLSEVTMEIDGRKTEGEVLPKAKAKQVYEEEKAAGNDSGMVEKDGFSSWDFHVGRVPARKEVRIRTVYYQPIALDTGVGKYLYPLEEGGTDAGTSSFWLNQQTLVNDLTIDVELKTAWPVADVRVPGFENTAKIDKKAEGHYKVRLEQPQAKLDRDFVFYYRLADDLPARLELMAYRPDERSRGTFMMVLTPGVALEPLNRGVDYTFCLDVSGSMHTKLPKLVAATKRALGELKPEDRFQIVTFHSTPTNLTGGLIPAYPTSVASYLQQLDNLQPAGGTNIYSALEDAMREITSESEERVQTLVLVTDGVANDGIVDPVRFHQLLKGRDVRFFGFLMGNSANWPLMRTLCDASGGYYTAISNEDDILGQILLAKSKVTHEMIHDARVEIQGTLVNEVTGSSMAKVCRGQQMVLFGRYDQPGETTVTLKARISGVEQTFTTQFQFPAVATSQPEIERLWALARIDDLDLDATLGRIGAEDARQQIESLGVNYGLVTDETSMVVLSDQSFAARGIDRRNRDRAQIEANAYQQAQSAPAPVQRVDSGPSTYTPPSSYSQPSSYSPPPRRERRPMFDLSPPRLGGGALDPFSALGLVGMAVLGMRKRKEDRA